MRTNRSGFPYLCVLFSLSLGCLAFLALSSGTETGEMKNGRMTTPAGQDSAVLDWFTKLARATQSGTVWLFVLQGPSAHETGHACTSERVSKHRVSERTSQQSRVTSHRGRESGWYSTTQVAVRPRLQRILELGPGDFDVRDLRTFCSLTEQYHLHGALGGS